MAALANSTVSKGSSPDDPGVVAGRDLEGVAGVDVEFAAIVHHDAQRPGQGVAEVAVLA